MSEGVPRPPDEAGLLSIVLLFNTVLRKTIFSQMLIKTLFAFLCCTITLSTALAQEVSERLVSDPKDKDNVVYLAYQYLAFNNYAKTIAIANEQLVLEPDTLPILYSLRAKAHEAQGNFASAVVDYEYYLNLQKKKLNDCLVNYQPSCVITQFTNIVDSYFRLFLLYVLKEGKTPQGLLSEYKSFLFEQDKDAMKNNRLELTAELKKLIKFLPQLEQRLKNVDNTRLRAEMSNIVLSEISEIQAQVMRQNEATAIINLMRIGVAARKLHAARNSFPGSFQSFFADPLVAVVLDKRLLSTERFPRLNGYEYLLLSDGTDFRCIARPVVSGKTGQRAFIVDSTYKIAEDINNDATLDTSDVIIMDLTR